LPVSAMFPVHRFFFVCMLGYGYSND
jgi:hypothetical protein